VQRIKTMRVIDHASDLIQDNQTRLV